MYFLHESRDAPSVMIRAITFDFWRTLFYANSNLQERREVRVDAVVRYTGASRDVVKGAMKAIDSEFLRVHIKEQRTLSPIDAIPMLELELDVAFGPHEAAALSDEFADALLLYPPEPLEGALEAVHAAAERVPVGLISDTGMVPGSRIQTLLEQHGFLSYLSHLSFSDEVGVAKPQPGMFQHAIDGLKVAPSELLHIGDLEPTDVKGAHSFGASAALFCADNDRYMEGSRAEFVFERWDDFTSNLADFLS